MDLDIHPLYREGLVAFNVGIVAKVSWKAGQHESSIIYERDEEICGLTYGTEKNVYIITHSRVICLNGDNNDIIYSVNLPGGYAGGYLALRKPQYWGENHDILISCGEGLVLAGTEGLGPLVGHARHKCIMQYYKQYIVIAYHEEREKSKEKPADSKRQRSSRSSVVIYDCENYNVIYSRHICADKSHMSIYYLFEHDDRLYIIFTNGAAYTVSELSLVHKLRLMLEKRAYPQAISIVDKEKEANRPIPPSKLFKQAGDEGCPAVYAYDPLVYLYLKQGDDLFEQGQVDQALDVYLSLPSFHVSHVLEKLLQKNLKSYTVEYLERLHSLGRASPVLSALLCTYYIYLSRPDDLRRFIASNKDIVFSSSDLNIYEIPPKIAREITIILKNDNMYVEFLIAVEKKYKEAVQFLLNIEVGSLKDIIARYAETLAAKEPDETCRVFSILGSRFPPRDKPLSVRDIESWLWPEDFARYFGTSEKLVTYVEAVLAKRWGINVGTQPPARPKKDSTPPDAAIMARDRKSKLILCSTLLELYIALSVLDPDSDSVHHTAQTESALRLMRTEGAEFDAERILFLCQLHEFNEGLPILYEKLGRYDSLVEYYLEKNEVERVIKLCSRTERCDLWARALAYALNSARKLGPDRGADTLRAIVNGACEAGVISILDLLEQLAEIPGATTEFVRGIALKPLRDMFNEFESISHGAREEKNPDGGTGV